ncbi:MAG: TetR/AcrR family transcriptional regulator, partial [Alteromonas oceani]
MSRVSARDKLLKAAGELFYDHGITATGVDAVITRAGVAKMSLYNNFKSKSELIAAYIDARH